VTVDVAATADALRRGDRTALGRAITLVESTSADDRERAAALLDAVNDAPSAAHRIGISGPPGVGKSTFIDAFGMALCEGGHKVAVLAIDPSSARTGGSILGDKTRMQRLSREASAFIRPSPARGVLGGVAARTAETLRLCEVAGFDVALVETVGVGQSEIQVALLVDTVVVLLAAGGGDELQGIKRGLLEHGDVLVVAKADGEHAAAAARTRADHAAAIAYVPPRHKGWQVPVLTCSAVEGTGLLEVREAIAAHRACLVESGTWDRQRGEQRVAWANAAFLDRLQRAAATDPAVAARLRDLTPDLEAGRIAPETAAAQLFAIFRGER
jgi:LAO/AO transport system kinase